MTDKGPWWNTDTSNDEVATAPHLWRPLADAMGGFDLDPASGAEPTPIADTRYTEDDDGLTEPWFGTVWLNPPFSDKRPWYRRLVNHYWNGDVDAAVAIATVDTSAGWFQDWFSSADVIGFPNDRDLYLGYGDSPSFCSMVGIWNPTDDAVDVLRGIGIVARTEFDRPTSLDEFMDLGDTDL